MIYGFRVEDSCEYVWVLLLRLGYGFIGLMWVSGFVSALWVWLSMERKKRQFVSHTGFEVIRQIAIMMCGYHQMSFK